MARIAPPDESDAVLIYDVAIDLNDELCFSIWSRNRGRLEE